MRKGEFSEYDCPRCIDERLVRVLGRILVCPNCDIVAVEPQPPVIVEQRDLGDEQPAS